MLPTPAQIRDAAYDRWRRRGGGHGQDRDDWLRAEQDLLFTLNYRVVARVGAGPSPEVSGNGKARDGATGVRICRFCERTAPRVRFNGSPGSDPLLSFCADGALTLVIPDECDDCRQQLDESVASDVARFVQTIRDIWAIDAAVPMPESQVRVPYVPIAALKGLTRMALACLPRAELELFEDTIEWVANPEHDRDARAFGPLSCVVHAFVVPFPAPWATLSLRVDDEAPMPYALFHLGAGRALFQIDIPLCTRDDDHDGEALIAPRGTPSLITGRPDNPSASGTISLVSTRPTRDLSICRL